MTSAAGPAKRKPAPKPVTQAPEAAAAAEPVEEDEQHRKFREALERKKSESHGSAGGATDGGHGAIGRGAGAKTQRMFRRKSG